MKVRTNLRGEELELVGQGLQTLAKAQRKGKTLPLENKAEREIVSRTDDAFDLMIDSLEEEIKTILE